MKSLRKIAEVDFPTQWARFRLLAFEHAKHSSEGISSIETAVALVLGDIYSVAPLVRIHSQCATGDIFHSLRCDCHDQLHLALNSIANEGRGILIYEHQEGRGIGLMEKLRAYALQDAGLDTVEANHSLGHDADLRDFQLPVEILRLLQIRSMRLMTGNPAKLQAVAAAGLEVVERVSSDVPISRHATRYMAVKREKMGYLAADEPVVTMAGVLKGMTSV
jgi:GTP cyclohydrolase II